jgi:apolipoprotein N-acyltransferase
MSKRKLLLLALLSGALLSPAWYSWGSGLFLLIAFIPLLIAENEIHNHSGRYKPSFLFLISLCGFGLFNLLTTWWVKNASFPGMIVAILLNSLLMSTVFSLYSLTRRKIGDRFGYISLIFYWIAYEYLYLNAEISWTWLNLGNGFANNIELIQWYEYTGTLGGTLWILAVNLLLFKIFVSRINGITFQQFRYRLITLMLILFVPSVYSYIRFVTYREQGNPGKILVLQPNIDPYLKFNDISQEDQMNIFLQLASEKADTSLDYIVGPETFINNNLWLDRMESNPSIQSIRSFLEPYPRTRLIVGATTYRYYPPDETPSETAKPFLKGYYDSFNSALEIDSTQQIQVYHKSQLVVGVEKMPYTKYLRFLEKIMLHLGGTFRSHGIQAERTCLISPVDSLFIATPICYESIFGEYVGDYLPMEKPSYLFIITNDGWWGDTPGYVQHNSFASLRAIETRRSVARSANTGISCFIDQRGKVLEKTDWWQRTSILMTLKANSKMTFYTLYGDYLGRISTFFGILFLLYTFAGILIRKRA